MLLASALVAVGGLSFGVTSVASASQANGGSGTELPAVAATHAAQGKEASSERPTTEHGKDAQGSTQQASGGAVAGDNGTVKIHEVGTAVPDRRNEPHVCRFYLDAFGFDGGQAVGWSISQHPPTGRATATAGAIVLGPDGSGHTGVIGLSDGHYKLSWTFVGEHGKTGKHKTFWVRCEKDHDKSHDKCVPTSGDKSGDDASDKPDDKADHRPDDKGGDKAAGQKPTDKPDHTSTKPCDDSSDDNGKDDEGGGGDHGKGGGKSTDVSGAKNEQGEAVSSAKGEDVGGLAHTGFPLGLALGMVLVLLGTGVAILTATGRLGLLRRRH